MEARAAACVTPDVVPNLPNLGKSPDTLIAIARSPPPPPGVHSAAARATAARCAASSDTEWRSCVAPMPSCRVTSSCSCSCAVLVKGEGEGEG